MVSTITWGGANLSDRNITPQIQTERFVKMNKFTMLVAPLLKRHNQSKIFFFLLPHMAIRFEHVHRLELRILFYFVLRIYQ